MFTEVVALVGDTIYLLDATAGEQRAARDSALLGTLFPGVHPVVVVQVNGAPPHLAGARYWAASGATLVASRRHAAFIRRMVDRDWSALPDRLEQRRTRVNPQVIATDSLDLAGGALQLRAIRGVTGGGALVAYLRDSGFIWASDHIQVTDRFNLYEADVVRTVAGLGWHPRSTAGPHTRVLAWAAFASTHTRR